MHIIDNFVLEKDANTFIKYFNNNDHLCNDSVEEHKHRNIHYSDIIDIKILKLLDYYAKKNTIFIDHLFSVKTKLWSPMRLCRWNKGDSMVLHTDSNWKDKMDYSSLIYLNDDYLGGELVFNKKPLKMKKLSCVLFKSDKYEHGVNKVIRGKRYTIPSWYEEIK